MEKDRLVKAGVSFLEFDLGSRFHFRTLTFDKINFVAIYNGKDTKQIQKHQSIYTINSNGLQYMF